METVKRGKQHSPKGCDFRYHQVSIDLTLVICQPFEHSSDSGPLSETRVRNTWLAMGWVILLLEPIGMFSLVFFAHQKVKRHHHGWSMETKMP